MNAAGQGEAENAGVVNNDHDNGERAEEIEPGLALTIRKTGVELGSPATAGKLRSEVRGQTKLGSLTTSQLERRN